MAHAGPTDLEMFEQAMEFHQKDMQLGDRVGHGNSYLNFGNAYMGLGKFDTALDFYLKKLTIEIEVMYKLGKK